MTDEIQRPDPTLTAQQQATVDQLTESELKAIDKALLSNATDRWRKVAMVIGSTMMHLPDRVPGIPDVFYAERVRKLVEHGLLESQGNLTYMRFSEVRLAPSAPQRTES